jgi:hypothetical protein
MKAGRGESRCRRPDSRKPASVALFRVAHVRHLNPGLQPEYEQVSRPTGPPPWSKAKAKSRRTAVRTVAAKGRVVNVADWGSGTG